MGALEGLAYLERLGSLARFLAPLQAFSIESC